MLKKQLKWTDRTNCRDYYVDRHGNPYCQYVGENQLLTCTSIGEPDCPISWDYYEVVQVFDEELPEIGRRFVEIAKQHMAATCDSSKKEATAYPFWTVEYKDGESLTGVFFSRAAAEAYRESRKNPDRFAVRCESGKYSEAYEAILHLAQSVLGGDPS